jgi:hypothetical protein
MNLLQMLMEQHRSPDGGMVTELARILIDDGLDQRIDDSQGCGRATGSWDVEEPASQIKSFTLSESLDPIVDGLAANPEQFGNLFDGFPIGEPEQGLRPTPLLSQRRMGDEVFQLSTESIAQEEHHRAISASW